MPRVENMLRSSEGRFDGESAVQNKMIFGDGRVSVTLRRCRMILYSGGYCRDDVLWYEFFMVGCRGAARVVNKKATKDKV